MHKTALITGGAKRLGRAMALHLASRGVNVVIHYSSSIDAAIVTPRPRAHWASKQRSFTQIYWV